MASCNGEATPDKARGAAYGFHQAMDNAGSLIGPLVGFALAAWLGLGFRTIFLVAAVPGVIGFLVVEASQAYLLRLMSLSRQHLVLLPSPSMLRR